MTEQFMAACGHMTTAKRLGHICPECYLNTHSELAKLKQENCELKERLEAYEQLIQSIETVVINSNIQYNDYNE